MTNDKLDESGPVPGQIPDTGPSATQMRESIK